MSKSLVEGLRHLAVIMDGNGRWARSRGHGRVFGHVRGARRARDLVKACSERKIPFLTLFAFSHENLARPPEEVISLFRLLERALLRHAAFLKELDIRLCVMGALSPLPSKTQRFLTRLMEETSGHKGLCLILALNYGARQEIAQAARALAFQAQEGSLKASHVDEPLFESRLLSGAYPPPDLIIRSGGEQRLSNFYLWQASYAELLFSKTLWPDWTEKDLNSAFEDFLSRKRRFGALPEGGVKRPASSRPRGATPAGPG